MVGWLGKRRENETRKKGRWDGERMRDGKNGREEKIK